MRNETRVKFDAYTARVAALSGVDDATKKFNVDPTVQQKLIDRQQESSDFLSRINVVPVTEQQGETIGLGLPGLIASRTDTSGAGRRVTRDPTAVTAVSEYFCRQTNYDTRLKYAKLDMWAKFPDFETRIRDFIVRGQAMDRIRVGFNGTSAAATTNPVNSPLGQDVNIGWLENLRLHAAEQVLNSGTVANKVTFGTHATADFKNIDALIYSAYRELLDPWYADETSLVAIVGRDLVDDKYFNVINQNLEPTEIIASDVIMSTKRMGKLPAYQVPSFPASKVLVTTFDNLSIYEQDGKRRRVVRDTPDIDAIENFESSNDAFVIEDYGLACLIENIEAKNAA